MFCFLWIKHGINASTRAQKKGKYKNHMRNEGLNVSRRFRFVSENTKTLDPLKSSYKITMIESSRNVTCSLWCTPLFCQFADTFYCLPHKNGFDMSRRHTRFNQRLIICHSDRYTQTNSSILNPWWHGGPQVGCTQMCNTSENSREWRVRSAQTQNCTKENNLIEFRCEHFHYITQFFF